MLLGYNTNGMAHHDLFDAVALLVEIGYRSVAITIDHGTLPPGDEKLRQNFGRLRRTLEHAQMRSVIETGARFLLDPQRKHEPTLLSADAAGRQRRIDFYKHAVDCAAELGSDCVSLWSGVLRDRISEQLALERLVKGLEDVCQYAAGREVDVAFEPEPGMLVDSMARFEELLKRFDAPNFRLTLDVGHLHCQGIDFPPVLRALAEAGYTGGVYVELSRHSHEAPEAARRAFDFVEPIIERI